jgi:hypothetical protein
MAGKDVLVMQPKAWMTDPSWFLVTGLLWPKDQAVAGWPKPRSRSRRR